MVEVLVGQDVRPALCRLNRPGIQQAFQVVRVDIDRILPQLAEQRPADKTGVQRFHQRFPLSCRNIDGGGGAVDQMEHIGNGGKGEDAAFIALLEGVQNPFLVQRRRTFQGAVEGEVGFDGLRLGGVGEGLQHMPGGVYIGADHGGDLLSF